MAAFERIRCGIEGLDRVFDNIRLGDNVVWQVDTLEDFRHFSDAFVSETLAEGRTVNYMRFSSTPPLVEERPGVLVHVLNPHKGFESFTIEVRNVITEQGRGALYVFDCLSELQVAWSADMMMGNFFRLTCPYLFELDTVAYFPILRGRHSFAAIARIRDTTQLLIDVCRDIAGQPGEHDTAYFVRPLKVWNRYAPTMFLAHRYVPATGMVRVCDDGVEMARFFSIMSEADLSGKNRNADSWDRFFASAYQAHQAGTIDEATCATMCDMMMSKSQHIREMVRRFFEPADYFAVRNRMVGTGLVGGKACGMLLARKIVERALPECQGLLEPHDSFYLGTDVFYSYIVENGLWPLRIRQREATGFTDAAPALQRGLLEGQFSEEMREQFRHMLEYYGQAPIIVRSSSFLEDGFGNAFAGKYESVFCANAGSLEERLDAFEDAVRVVYASTMDPSALEYRLRNGLDRSEEQMALLVQRVSGSYCDNGGRPLFFPTAAGVGYSHAAYRFMRGTDPDAGMLRIVAGLGTRAVDRTGRDYPRLVSLDRPRAVPVATVAEKHRFSQRYADVLDLAANDVVELDVQELASRMQPGSRQAVFEHDRDAEQLLANRGRRRNVVFASCEGLVADRRFTSLMSGMLSALQKAYGCAVDIEYTVNVAADKSFVVNLLQCRPLRMFSSDNRVEVPNLPGSDVFFSIEGEAMGASRAVVLDAVVVVGPEGYYRCPHAAKSLVAQVVGRVGERLAELGAAHVLLLAPGRIGTSSPELGVPVSFAQIASYEGICEVAYSAAGYSPELSYGSHLFQDLVEADIYYGALLEDERKALYHPALVERMRCVTDRILSGWSAEGADGAVAGIVAVYDARGTGLKLWHDHVDNRSVCGFSSET